MINAAEYRMEREKLMERWEKECRDWLEIKTGAQVKATFFKDGVVDPDTWFNNDFRPLFILKEVHDEENQKSCIDFVAMEEGSDFDIWNRKGKGMWAALGALAKGILSSRQSKVILPYEQVYYEDLKSYRNTLRQIAIMNVKKLSAGGTANSKESLQTVHFEEHANKFKDFLQEQIELINPTIIICCGDNFLKYLDIKEDKIQGVPVVKGLHPSRNPNRWRNKFYNETIRKVNDILS